MKLLTIGEFARQARLSAKALRLYDELGLLRPARVDQWSGYGYYVLPAAVIRRELAARAEPAEVVQRLITLANEAGGPDNIACALADIEAAC